MEKGKLSVQTENILPLIKKWLYSEKEIFLRELISNSLDAINKLKKISLTEEIRDPEDVEYAIDIKIDKENGIISIEDNGIGMSSEEIKKYITQIAFSGAEEFIKKYEESGDKSKAGIIGNFGLGFYSSFMISKRVEIDSLSYRTDETSASWASDGGEDFEIAEGTRTKRGTTIRMYVEDEEKEFLDENRIKGLVKKYCDFLSVPIRVEGNKANKEKPLWTRPPSEISKEEYLEFYKHLFPYQGDPLFHIHMNVDYPFQFQGILYFPRMAYEMDVTKNNVRIYCKQVFVTEEAQEIVPKFLTILKGVIDLPDLPLNVSRSYIQNEPQVKKIAQHIIKKVADKLSEEFKSNRNDYEKIWDDISSFVKYGMLNEEKFYDQAKDALIFEIARGIGDDTSRYVTLDEYQTANKLKTESKIYYATNVQNQAGPLRLIQKQGIDVILFTSLIDTHFLHFLETKNPDFKFVRVDAEISDSILDKDEDSKILDSSDKDIKERLIKIFEKVLPDESIQVRVEAFKSADLPAMILLPEQARRFNDMTAIINQSNPNFLSEHTLVVNIKNSLIKKIAQPSIVETEGETYTKQEKIARQVYFLARLAQGGVAPKEIDSYVEASFNFLDSFS